MSRVDPIPPGYHTVTPSIIVKDPRAALDFYQRAFGAEEILCLNAPDGSVMHAEFKIGNSPVMLGGEWPDFGMVAPKPGASSGSLNLYVADVDAAFQRAVAAGCTAMMPPADMFWGDRYCKVVDPYGHIWGLATHIEDVPPEECARRAASWKPS